LFSYQSTDGQAVSRLAIVSITVSAVNDAPAAVDDAVSTTEDHPVSGNVLTNDTDVDSGTLTVANPGRSHHARHGHLAAEAPSLTRPRELLWHGLVYIPSN